MRGFDLDGSLGALRALTEALDPNTPWSRRGEMTSLLSGPRPPLHMPVRLLDGRRWPERPGAQKPSWILLVIDLELVPYGDCYQIPASHMHGLTVRDIDNLPPREAAIKEFFAAKE
jgi:hypothetical protein